MPSSRSVDELAELRPILGREPSMSAMTRTGMCCAYSWAASTTSRPSNPSMSESQNARVAGSRNCALMATMSVLADMRPAPTAGVIMKPVPKVIPAAMGMATAL